MIRTVKMFNNAVGIGVLVLMAIMVLLALRDMRRGGSLDDLPAEDIREAVHRAAS